MVAMGLSQIIFTAYLYVTCVVNAASAYGLALCLCNGVLIPVTLGLWFYCTFVYTQRASHISPSTLPTVMTHDTLLLNECILDEDHLWLPTVDVDVEQHHVYVPKYASLKEYQQR